MARTRTSSVPELLLAMDREGPVALHRQLERGLQEAIRKGRLGAGAALPSTRSLADELGVSRGVVVEAYEQLVAEGYLESRPGGKTRVAARAAATVPRRHLGGTGGLRLGSARVGRAGREARGGRGPAICPRILSTQRYPVHRFGIRWGPSELQLYPRC